MRLTIHKLWPYLNSLCGRKPEHQELSAKRLLTLYMSGQQELHPQYHISFKFNRNAQSVIVVQDDIAMEGVHANLEGDVQTSVLNDDVTADTTEHEASGSHTEEHEPEPSDNRTEEHEPSDNR